MMLKSFLKWRLNELTALRALDRDGPEYRQRMKNLCADATPVCAAEILKAEPGSGLERLRARRKLWSTAGYAVIALFLATVAAFVLSYWLASDHRASWLTSGVLIGELAAVAVEVALMLLCARQVTALQNRRIEACAAEALADFDALPGDEADFVLATLRQPARPEDPAQRCGCCACGAVFRFSEVEVAQPGDEKCPMCGTEYQLVFEAPEMPLFEDNFNRLRSFING